ncbi:MAG TPA: hypothetical protein VF092_18185 [Longimicrobium sp.]
MPETVTPQDTMPLDDRTAERNRRLAEAGVRIPSGTPRPPRIAGRRRPWWLAALIRLFS